MGSGKELIGDSVRFEALFDESTGTYGKEAFKEKVFQDLMSRGERVEIDMRGDDRGDMLVKKIDAHASQGYNVFSNVNEYEAWMQQSLRDPTQEEVMEALKDG